MPPHAPYNESELIRELADGNPLAFKVIFDRYFISGFYFAKHFVTHTQAAEDITTETFLKCWEKCSDFENIHKLQSFLHINTRNACINALHSEKRQTESEKQLSYLLTHTGKEGMKQQELTARIYQYVYEEIEKLPAQEKNIFKLAYIDGLSNEEIARQLGINNQSVRNYKTRPLKTMRMVPAVKDI